MVVLKDRLLLLVFLLKQVVIWVKGSVRLTKTTRPGVFSHSNPDPGHPTPRKWRRLRTPSSVEVRVRWACLAIFFLALGLGEVCAGDAWNLLSEGTGTGGFPAGQSSRGDQCTGTGPF